MKPVESRLVLLRESLYNGIAILMAIMLPGLMVVNAWNTEVEKAENAARTRFEVRAGQIRDAITGRAQDYEQVLRGAAGLFAASGNVGRDDWRAYFESLKLDLNYPGIQGIGYSAFVANDELPAFLARIRSEGNPGYVINPPGERSHYVLVKYIEPFSGRNMRAFGFDGYSDPVRRSVLDRAMRSGSPAISGKVRLAQEIGEIVQPGLVMYTPIYRKGLSIDTPVQRERAISGFVFGHFRVGDLMRRLFGLGQWQGIALMVYDGRPGDPSSLLYSNVPVEGHVPQFSWGADMTMLGQPFNLRVVSTNEFEDNVDYSAARMVLVGGSSLYLLLLAMLWSLWNTRTRAVGIAEKMTREVRRREAEWQAISDASPLGIFRSDEKGRMAYANPRFEALSGLPVEALLDKGWLDAVHPDDRNSALVAWETAIARQSPEISATYRLLHPGGTELWVSFMAALILEDGRFAGYVGVAEDVTERRQFTETLMKSRERLGLALEGSNLALFDWDIPSGEVRLSQQWGLIMDGEKVDTVTTIKALNDLVHPDDMPRLQDNLEKVLKGHVKFYEVQHRVRNRQGEWRWILSRAKVTERDAQGNALRLVGTNADITAGKEVERVKNEFIATVSHELRTPLTAIIGSLSLIRETAENLDPEVAGFIDMASQNSDRLAALINDVLDIEKIGSGQMTMNLRTISLREQLEKAVSMNMPYADIHNVKLNLLKGADFQVSADSDRLMQVLTNLISNAAKFSPPRAEVEVSAVESDGKVRVNVRDHGAGIPDNFRSQIFQRFERADNSNTRRKGGTGLGLAISKALIEHMNGRIDFDSAEGQGSTFYFELPVVKDADA